MDECHQAIRDHAYGSIIKQYQQIWQRKDPNTRLPRLFAITTALLKTHCTPKQLEERIDNLQHFFWYGREKKSIGFDEDLLVICIVQQFLLPQI